MKFIAAELDGFAAGSLPVRGARVEITGIGIVMLAVFVAPRAWSVG